VAADDQLVAEGYLASAQWSGTIVKAAASVTRRRRPTPTENTPVAVDFTLVASGGSSIWAGIVSHAATNPALILIHLSSVYRKLGISSRSQLPAVLAESLELERAAVRAALGVCRTNIWGLVRGRPRCGCCHARAPSTRAHHSRIPSRAPANSSRQPRAIVDARAPGASIVEAGDDPAGVGP
jgi:hypothetical protein